MPEQTSTPTTTGRSLGPEDIANRSFPSARKGLDPEAVRRFLAEVAAQVRDLRAERAEFRAPIPQPRPQLATPKTPEAPIDEAALTRVLGEEMTRVLQTARESARAIVLKAERQAAELVAGAESLSQNRRAEAESSVASLMERARLEAAELIEKTKIECREMIEEARETRLKVLADLAERRRILLIQLEQVRIGKDSIVAVVESVATKVTDSIDAVRAQLSGAEEGSRVAADRAASDLEAAIAAGQDVETLMEQTLAKIPIVGVPGSPDKPDHGQTPPVKPRVFDIEREQMVRPVSVSAVSPETGNESSALMPGLSKEGDTQERSVRRVPDSTPTASQELRTVITAERAAIHGAAPVQGGPSNGQPGSIEADHDAHPVDQLFAKIRASRESNVADAQRVLSHEPETPPKRQTLSRRRAKPLSPNETPVESPVENRELHSKPALETPAAASAVEQMAKESETEEGEGSRQRRDRELEPAHLELSRSLKRVLREEQNLLLDALRNRKKNQTLATLLPGSATRIRLVESMTPGVLAAFYSGYGFLGEAPPKAKANVLALEKAEMISGRVAGEILEALNSRLGPRFEKGSEDDGEISAIVGSAFREWKTARVESLALDSAIDAFGAGEIAYARTMNTSLAWNLDDSANACPDCDDNGVAGKVIAGQPFPTGHLHPPVHPGCRCFLSS